MGIIAERWVAGERVQLSVHRATGVARLAGLIGRGAPPPGCALLIPRCRCVHGFGMRERLDAVFARRGTVLAVRELRPFRVAACPRADAVFELRAGEARRLGIRPGTAIKRRERGTFR